MTGACRREAWLALFESSLYFPPHPVSFQALQIPKRIGLLEPVTPTFIHWAHKQNLSFQVWTVNDPEQMNQFMKWGVDAILTDRPDLALNLVKQYAQDDSISEMGVPSKITTGSAASKS
jgi:glycerophosphoryl diester phosphodiesterase